MNLIIDDNEFDVKNIRIKKNLKILYNYKNIQLLGIPLIIKFKKQEISDNNIKLYLEEKYVKLIKNIDEYFSRFSDYKPLLIDNYFAIHKNKTTINNYDEVIININSLKKKDNILYLDIYTI